MSAYKEKDTACLLGYLIANDCIDTNAAIAISKLGTETKRLDLGLGDYTDATVNKDGVFPTALFHDAGAKHMYKSFPLPKKYDSGDLKLVIVWKTAVIINDAKFQLSGRSSPADGSAGTASEFTGNVVTTAHGVANRYIKSEITILEANVAAGDQVGLDVYRDPADAADDLAADLYVVNMYLEFLGRG
ncbi:hypothetical protein KAR91_45500 [Candidatus Pacearchaeota archaeon]|nr:hypothetical protein [Candidatus Pacearchaeota archaeon]